MATARKPPRVAFGKKNAPPRAEEFAARLPLAAGRRFDALRAFLRRQRGVTEDIHFFGPKTGWAFRYLRGTFSVCVLTVRADRPLGILSLVPSAAGLVDWKALSPVGQRARKDASGSPTLTWLSLPLEASGAADFKILLRAKLRTLPAAPAGDGAIGTAPDDDAADA